METEVQAVLQERPKRHTTRDAPKNNKRIKSQDESDHFYNETLMEATGLFLCKLCKNNVRTEEYFKLGSCSHGFCLLCHIQYINTKISQHVMDIPKIRCMAVETDITPCKRNYTHEEVIGVLSHKHARQFKQQKEKYIRFYKTYTGTFVQCPKAECTGGYELESSNSSIAQIQCNKCGVNFCKYCNGPHHEDECGFCKRCNSNHQKVLDCFCLICGKNGSCQCVQSNSMLHDDYRICPSCHTIIEKSGPCDHIECAKCKYDFCYHCGDSYYKGHMTAFHGPSKYTIDLKPPLLFIHTRFKSIQRPGNIILPTPIVYINRQLYSDNLDNIHWTFEPSQSDEFTKPPEIHTDDDEFVAILIKGVIVPSVPKLSTLRLRVRVGNMTTYSDPFFVICTTWMQSGPMAETCEISADQNTLL